MNIKIPFLAALCMAVGLGMAEANDRYGQRPPVVLSPDLTVPWVTQLRQPSTAHGAGRVVKRRSKARWGGSRVNTRVASINRSNKARTAKMNPIYLPQTVAYQTHHKPGTIVIDTPSRFLYLVLGNGQARR